MRLNHERGEGIVLYLGDQTGSRFIGCNLGFSGYTGPRLRYRFYTPTLHIGRLFSDDRGQRFSTRIEDRPLLACG